MATWTIQALSLALCLSAGFQQGYIASVLNQPYLQIQKFINESWIYRTGHPMGSGTLVGLLVLAQLHPTYKSYFFQDMLWSFLNICFPIAMIFGQFLAAYLCRRIGRRYTALLASALYIPATLLSAASKICFPAFEMLFVGRILWSLACGINSVNATVWIVECAPPAIRGRMAAMQEFFMAIGALITQALGVPFADDALWPWIFLPNVAFVIASMIMFGFLHDSPQYIIQKTGDPEQADYGVIKTEHSSMAILFMPWKARDPLSQVIRHGAWLGVMVKIAYVFTGARCIRAYSTFILYSMAGWSHKAALFESLMIGFARLPTTLIPVLLVDRFGRRPLLIISTIVCFISLGLMIVGIDIGPSWRIATLVGLTTVLLISACGIGSLSRFYAAELVPRSILLESTSILTMFEALTKIGIEFAFYPLANVVGASSIFELVLFSHESGV
ncbi:transporter, major facilitator family protein [Ostertagia ostertagi]